MSLLDRAKSLKYMTAPINQGQMVTVSYAVDYDMIFERVSDGYSVDYYCRDLKEDDVCEFWQSIPDTDGFVKILPPEIEEMAKMLENHGKRYTGNNVEDEARGWIDEGFNTDSADTWCEIGVWDASTAAEFRDAGLTPHQVSTACEILIEADDRDNSEYTDGDPVYSVCNNDTSAKVIIDACRKQ